MADVGKSIGLVKLCDANLSRLSDKVSSPTYDRKALTPGIVHIGLGNFHRAHQAWYLHRLMQSGDAYDWAIIGAGVRPSDAIQRDLLKSQDYLTTLIELDPAGGCAEVTGSMIGYLPVEETNGALIAQMAQSAIRIVSLTVTEGGYYIDPATGAFNAQHADVIHDVANPETPRTAFGAMIAALKLRRDRGIGPFTGQSCDNLQGNGTILRQTLVSLAQLTDPSLANWIDENCTFPNSMVDCIVPATGPSERSLVHEYGIKDAAPVTHENFRQWVTEDSFCAGRPAWQNVGVTISDDVHSFEAMKIRILNGGHQVIADAGDILGLNTIADTMANPFINGFLNKVMTDEVAPHVASVPDMTPIQYLDVVMRRFSNPKIKDTTRRVSFDGSSRHPGFIVPSIRDALAEGSSVNGLALVSALWARYCLGLREDGSIVAPNDPIWDDLKATAERAKKDPPVWLNMRNIYGDLRDNSTFCDAFSRWLRALYRDGVEATLSGYLST